MKTEYSLPQSIVSNLLEQLKDKSDSVHFSRVKKSSTVKFPHLIVLLFGLTNGIIKTIQAIKKIVPPMKVRTSLFFKLDAIKKSEHITKSTQPASWYLISFSVWYFGFSFIVLIVCFLLFNWTHITCQKMQLSVFLN